MTEITAQGPAERLRAAAGRLEAITEACDLWAWWPEVDDENEAIRHGGTLGNALTAWLNSCAEWAETNPRHKVDHDPETAAALAVADAILDTAK